MTYCYFIEPCNNATLISRSINYVNQINFKYNFYLFVDQLIIDC
ncbi:MULTISPECIES: hypothetical protein [unclassified Rickettsia]